MPITHTVRGAALSAVLFGAVIAPAGSAAQKATQSKPAVPTTAMFGSGGSFAPMLARVLPAVVTILVTSETPQPVEFQPRRPDGTLVPSPIAKKGTSRSGGSGVIVDRTRGHILTNYHVIEDAVRIEVVLADGRRMLARVVGGDAATDCPENWRRRWNCNQIGTGPMCRSRCRLR